MKLKDKMWAKGDLIRFYNAFTVGIWLVLDDTTSYTVMMFYPGEAPQKEYHRLDFPRKCLAHWEYII